MRIGSIFSIGFFVLLTGIVSHGADVELPDINASVHAPVFLKEMKKKRDWLVSDKKAMAEFKKRYGFLSEKREELDEELVERLRTNMRGNAGRIFELAEGLYGARLGSEQRAQLASEIESLEKDSKRLYPTVFYLFTLSQPEGSITRFMEESTQLKKLYPGTFQAYGVIRGFPKKGGLKTLFDRFYSKSREGFVLKVHPYIFRMAGIDRAPAYLFSECPEEFRFKRCKNEYLVRGDVSLAEALKIVSDRDERYRDYYLSLIEGFNDETD